MDQDWFEMREVRRRRLADSVWIPLRQCKSVREGRYGHLGHTREFVGLGSIAIPLARREAAERLSWMDIGLVRGQASHAFPESYKPADVYQFHDEVDLGTHLVLEQSFGGSEPSIWHLHQDLMVALELMREGDLWVCPNENYLDVVRLTRNPDGSEGSIEIRAEFLRDYLAARRMALKLSTYRCRLEILDNADHISWPNGKIEETADDGRFLGHINEIHEGGNPFGATAAVLHVTRTNVDHDVDVPTISSLDDKDANSRSWEVAFKGRKLVHVEGEFWRDEWIEPAEVSARVRGDEIPAATSFIVDAAGARRSSDELKDEDDGRWLWFEPTIIPALLNRRGGSLIWHTRETGTVAASYGNGVHFGINSEGLTTAYARDVARLPAWQQRIWMGHNVSPNGKVSSELLAAQAEGRPASTQAPEAFLGLALDRLNEAFCRKWGSPLFRVHKDTSEVIRNAHRFRATDGASLLALAKDIARLTADSIDAGPLHAIVPLEAGERRGSLKSLERVLGTIAPADAARRVMGPLVGIYNLRLGDAHMASSEIEEEFALVGIDPAAKPVEQGFQLLDVAVQTLFGAAEIIENSPVEPVPAAEQS